MLRKSMDISSVNKTPPVIFPFICSSERSLRNDSEECLLGPREQLALLLLLGIFEPLGVLLNAGTLVMFIRDGLWKSASNALITNLVFSDLLVSCIVLPGYMGFLATGGWLFGRKGCLTINFCFHLLGCVTINTMTTIAIERYYTVTRGKQGIGTLTRHLYKVVVCLWLFSLLLASPPLFGWSQFHFDEMSGVCAPDWTVLDGARGSYAAFLFLFGFVLPIGLQGGFYFSLYRIVSTAAQRARYNRSILMRNTIEVLALSLRCSRKSSFRQSSWLSSLLLQPSNFNNERRLAHVMALMVTILACTWLPYSTAQVLVVFGIASPRVLLITAILPALNVVCNPVIYVFYNRKFKMNLKKCHTTLVKFVPSWCQSMDDIPQVSATASHSQSRQQELHTFNNQPDPGYRVAAVRTCNIIKPPELYTIKEDTHCYLSRTVEDGMAFFEGTADMIRENNSGGTSDMASKCPASSNTKSRSNSVTTSLSLEAPLCGSPLSPSTPDDLASTALGSGNRRRRSGLSNIFLENSGWLPFAETNLSSVALPAVKD